MQIYKLFLNQPNIFIFYFRINGAGASELPHINGAGASELSQDTEWLDATQHLNSSEIFSYPQDSGKDNIVMEHLAP
ncbi:hypothetical protein HDR70_05315 [bacterium]|nr:hypothetical protein [bacterium]